jgi:filamentous hemagglutinin
MDEADDFVAFSSRRADIDPNGVMDVVAHGTPNKIQIMTENGPVWVNHRVAANLIKQDPSYSRQPIRSSAN